MFSKHCHIPEREAQSSLGSAYGVVTISYRSQRVEEQHESHEPFKYAGAIDEHMKNGLVVINRGCSYLDFWLAE